MVNLIGFETLSCPVHKMVCGVENHLLCFSHKRILVAAPGDEVDPSARRHINEAVHRDVAVDAESESRNRAECEMGLQTSGTSHCHGTS